MFSKHEHEVLRVMEEMGGSFVSHLARAWRSADARNANKLKATFHEYWGEYEAVVKHRAARKEKP